MSFSRYQRDKLQYDGKGLSAARGLERIRRAISNGSLPIVRVFTTTDADRLDTIAGSIYGDGRYWWVVAAASNIGWGLQVPPGTIINIVDLSDVENLVG